ncbi:2-oxoglutarate-Fe(II) type oxidoreductase hxnY-like isoform X2 [Ricinus communis]|uniref:2-oxoglutarate-Fe(II) type oxidoreductase hxnY-like isoform X2 n=1 Tax=Ricinus communis TaxID=3988 RepID=UPI00201AEFA2|nr:2-oxoglutarate-Fe(II) type oxidoreductase hxnY-like isoform X2 [Ricinus communis]
MAEAAKLQVIDLSSPHISSVADSIRQACVEYGFFYLVNHGVEEELIARVFEESSKFFSLSLDDKKKLLRKEYRGYSPLFAENLDPSSRPEGDSKESFDIGNLEKSNLNQWPSEEVLPHWRSTMEAYYCKVMSAGKRLSSLMALALNLEKDYFERIGALDKPECYLRLLHYPSEVVHREGENMGASAHSDYGMITLLLSNGVPGLQVCKDKFKEPRIWEDVLHVNGAFIVNIGDLMERWTNCLFGSTLHRVIPTGQERFSLVFFLFPDPECIVQCLKSCCSESCPQSGDYLEERFGLTFGSKVD